MASKSSSEPAHPAPHAVHHEWRTAQNSASYLLPKINSMSEQNSKLKLLDVGAGSGSISVTLAQLIPDGHITAIDINPDILPRARAVAEMVGVTNINFEQGDAHKLSYADESFDITICHQILFHLKEPWIVLREMMRVTKAGGIVGAREGDLDTECIWPELPGLLSLHNFAASMMKDGGTSTAGRQLLPWALKAGVARENITLSYGTWSFSTSEDKKTWSQGIINMCRNGRIREGALKSKRITEDGLDEIIKDYEEWSRREDASIAMMQGEIIIHKYARDPCGAAGNFRYGL